jgi:hypothetical protein
VVPGPFWLFSPPPGTASAFAEQRPGAAYACSSAGVRSPVSIHPAGNRSDGNSYNSVVFWSPSPRRTLDTVNAEAQVAFPIRTPIICDNYRLRPRINLQHKARNQD